MLYVRTEEEFKSYPWCRRILRGLGDEARKKRVPLREIGDAAQIPPQDRETAVLLIGASEAWIGREALRADALGVHPIALTNRPPAGRDGAMSAVMMDIPDSMRLAVDYLRSLGCERLGLYGVNPAATSDPWRAEVFQRLTKGKGGVFVTQRSLQHTFECFRSQLSACDGVICASDYAALSLVRRLGQVGAGQPGSPYLLGYGNLFLSRLSSPSITSISDDYEHFGRAALAAYHLVVREKTVSSVNILLHSRLHVRETTGGRPYAGARHGPEEAGQRPRNPFYEDGEVSRMAMLETLLGQCDETDFAVLQCLMHGDTYAATAEKCFVSETAAKYRVKKMEKMCGANSRGELVSFLREFF
ncbi:substrate-binding domain-containing protein [Anaerofilum sp. BX8]|uniref:Substrate-binding domain-containing protein n=1 Tax=Anaerofilum hominis TaxID=2763016 RepID=A0A923IB28_9FIRM|nr:substrate-binding domain-containing protein [Anaerofilum hominis]MBC5581593.1 substrate-binding domain-containing protein [Anaerofilum hominis]